MNKKKNISLAELRKEGKPDQKGDHKSGKHQDKFKGQRRPFKGGHRKDHKKGGKNSGERLPKDPEARKEFLDKEMEQYWIKGGHKELGKSFKNYHSLILL